MCAIFVPFYVCSPCASLYVKSICASLCVLCMQTMYLSMLYLLVQYIYLSMCAVCVPLYVCSLRTCHVRAARGLPRPQLSQQLQQIGKRYIVYDVLGYLQ